MESHEGNAACAQKCASHATTSVRGIIKLQFLSLQSLNFPFSWDMHLRRSQVITLLNVTLMPHLSQVE